MLQLLLIRECKGINRTEQSGDLQEQYGGSYGGSYVSLKCADEESNQQEDRPQQNSKPRPISTLLLLLATAAAARSAGPNFGESPPAAPHQFRKEFFFFL